MNVAQRRLAETRGGFALIMLIVVIAIGLIIYLMMIQTVMPGLGNRHRGEPKVWDEEWRLDPCSPEWIAAAKKARRYLPMKPAILEETTLTGDVQLGGEPRGRVKLVFSPDGKVSGSWQSEYEHDQIRYRITAKFSGVTDSTKLYEEGGAAQPELLYFITRGDYTQDSLDVKHDMERRQTGVVYAAGWLDLGLAARGEITLTTDRTWSAVYRYSAAR